MKKILLIFTYFLLFGCKTVTTKEDYNFIWRSTSYLDNKVFDEYIYDSKTEIYISKESNSPNEGFTETKIKVVLDENELKKIHDLYVKLNILNPNRCINNKKTGELLEKSVIRFYANKIKWHDESCNVDTENEKFNNLWGEIDRAITCNSHDFI